jgi:hypothetical protein
MDILYPIGLCLYTWRLLLNFSYVNFLFNLIFAVEILIVKGSVQRKLRWVENNVTRSYWPRTVVMGILLSFY